VQKTLDFDRSNIRPVGGRRERDARADRTAVHHQRAGAAYAVPAADMRSGEKTLLADEIRKRKTVVRI
jgi:hypothetical protein